MQYNCFKLVTMILVENMFLLVDYACTGVDKEALEKTRNFFAAFLPECWNPNPQARLSALRVKKNISKFYTDIFSDNN